MTLVEDRRQASGLAEARMTMIDSQLRVSGVNAPFVLARMGAVPREDFVPKGARANAYIDRAIALGQGRYLAAPVVQGRMLEEAAPQDVDRALLVDGGSGYMTELLRPLVSVCLAISPQEAVAKNRKTDDFTLLIIDGAVVQLPTTLTDRLAEGARVVTGLVVRGVTRLAVGRKTKGAVALTSLAEMGIPVLPEFDVRRGWSF
jgi:protein-L-isoaspartate(D-aspartate) O-methyltransferase